MKIRYLEEGEEIPNIEVDYDPDEIEHINKFRLPDIQTYSWVDEIKVVLDEGAILPTRGHSDDAGFDLYAPKNMHPKHLWKGDSVTIDTGVHLEIPKGCCGVIISKSGLNVNHNVTSHGLIDSGYVGSIRVKLYNHGSERLKIEPGDKISQIVIMPCFTPRLLIADKLRDTERGSNGFGSTGRK